MSKITVLTSPRAHAAKTISAQGVHSFDTKALYLTSFEEHEVGSIFDLAALMHDIERDKHSFVIRGEPLPELKPGGLVRRLKNAQADGTPASFREVARPYVMIDIDSLQAPDGVDSTSIDAVHFAVGQLPVEFHQASVFYQFSANAGFRGQTIKLHLWYWLDRPIEDNSLRVWAKEHNKTCGSKLIDPALFQGVQPHFVAGPILDGVLDPLAKRSALIEKSAHVVKLNLLTPTFEHRVSSHSPSVVERHSAQAWLEVIGDHSGGEGFHEPLRSASWALVEEYGVGEIEAIREILRTSILAADKSAHSESDIARYLSDPYLNDLITGAGRKQKHGNPRSEFGVEPHFHSNEVDAKTATSELHEIISKFLNDPKDTVVRITTGAGKTSSFVKELLRRGSEVGPGFIFVPSHKLAAEVEVSLRQVQSELKIQVISGRSEANCRAIEKVNAVSKAGMPVTKSSCIATKSVGDETETIKCPFYDECSASGYMAQFKGVADIYVLASAYLSVNLPDGLPEPRWLMIDESFYENLFDIVEVTYSDILIGPFGYIGRAIFNGLREGRDPLEVCESSGVSKDDLSRAIKDHYSRWTRQFNQVVPNEIHEAIYQSLQPLNSAVKLFGVLREAMESGATACAQVMLQSRKDGEVVVVSALKRDWKTAPVLNLDATADRRIMELILPYHTYHQIDVKQNIRVTQVHDHRLSKTALTDEKNAVRTVAKCQGVIDSHAQKYPRALVVTYKKIKAKFVLPEGWAIEHFGGLRGLDHYKNVDAVFIFGNSRPPIPDMEARAAALMADTGKGPEKIVGKLPDEMRGYRMVGWKFGVQTPVHPDPLVQALIEQSRESEIMQAIGRARSIHGRLKPVDVFLVSSIPVDVTVDRLLTFDELSAGGAIWERLARRFHGVVPASPCWLVENAPDIFSNEKKAQNWIKRNWAHIANSTYSNVSLIEGTFRKVGQRGANPNRFIVLAEHRAPRAMLEEQVGEIAKYDGPEDRDLINFVTLKKDGEKYYYRTRIEEVEVQGAGVVYQTPELYRIDNPPLIVKQSRNA